MIDGPLLLAFVAAAAVLTVTPGVDTAMVLGSATVDGKRAAVSASSGIALGCLVWGGAVSLGLGAVLRASELAYTVVKFAGAAYLLWLGSRLLMRPRGSMPEAADRAGATGAAGAFRRGFLTNLLNPKIGVFYVTFLPQFVPAGANVAGYTFFLACVHVVLTLAWFCVIVLLTAPLRRFLARPAALRALDRLTGVVFVGFGLRLATSQYS